MVIRVRLPDPMGKDMGIIFYSWVTSVPDLNQDGYMMNIFSHPRIIQWISDTLLPL
jgi:hypothetical protein